MADKQPIDSGVDTSVNAESQNKVRLVNRLREDQFIKYRGEDILIPPQGTVELDESGLTDLPTTVSVIKI